LETIQRLGKAAEFRDDETGEHIKRVGRYCEVLAKVLGLSPDRQKELFYASSMHDVGKIGVPDGILLKAGPLSPEEFEIMKRHTIIGAKILSGSHHPILKLAEILALTHHERWDGKGYPYGLSGEEIPIEGRICALADFFDACTSSRIYRPPLSNEKVLNIIKEESGKHFDPRVVQAFFDILPDILAIQRGEGED
jgi:putative two-component system response regulator